MKNRIFSFFIASVLAISSIGFGPDVQPAFAIEPEDAEADSSRDEESVNTEDVESYEETESDSVSEPADVKIISFGELPEDVAYQEVKAGTALDEIIFPDTLQIDVVPDPDREERLNKKLGEERQREREESEDEEEEDDAGEAASSEDEDGASEASSDDLTDPDEEVVFFESDTDTDKSEDEDGTEHKEDSENTENPGNIENTENTEKTENTDETENSQEPENTEDPVDAAEPETTVTSENSEEPAPAEDLVGWIRSAFESLTVYAAEDVDDTNDPEEESISEENVPEETPGAENEDDGISHEFVSDVKWFLDPDNNATDTYNPDLVGTEYVFIPVLLVPDFYYIEAELPTITVKILEDNFAFDETVEVDGVKIRVRAEKGVFPEGATIHAKRLEYEEEQTVREAVSESEQGQGFVVKSYSFDIQILDKDEKEIEPDTEKGKVIVSFETEEADNEELHSDIYHITEEEVEKLHAVVVDGEENKAVEAVTDSFSKYTLVFTWDEYEIEWPSEKSYVCLDDAFKNSGYLVGNLVIDTPDSDIVYANASDSDFFYFARLKSTAATDADDNVIHTPVVSEGCFEVSDDDADAAWFIVLRKPFVGNTKKVTVTCDRDGTESTITINITGNEVAEASYVHEYPYGIVPGATDFALKVKADSEDEGVVYQWQYKKNGKWVNIDLANSGVFGGSFDGAPYVAGDWFRCLLNGKESKAVQLISAASDGNSRTWTGPYKGDSNRYYVSNGTVAYTVDNDQGKTIIDVVGQFSKGGKAYMVQTTRSGEGWTIITDADAAPASGSFASGTADLDELYLGFSEDAPARLCVEADLGSLEKALAIGTDCAIGNEEIRDNVPLAGTLIADLNSQRNITKVSYIGISSRDAAQSAMNNDRGTEYPAISLVPVTVHGLRAWINNTGTPEPYKFADGSSTVKVDGQDFANVKLLCENSAANEAMSWIDAAAGSIVSFNFEIGSLATATSFKNVKDARYEYTANISNIKNGKLVGDELRKYAITVAEPMDSVLELMRIKTPSSVKSGLSSKVKALTSSSSNSYKADYLDISILQTSDNATYNNKTVTEVRKDSKDAGSAVMPLKIELTYDFSNKETVKLFREHNGTIEELTESNSGTDGTYVLNENAGKIYIYSYKFSQFAVAYKQEVYYTVTFDDGTSKTSVKVKAGEKVSKPADPSKEGYTFKGWYLKGSSSSASVFNFDTAITKDTNLVAGWTAAKDKKTGTDDDSDENDSRAPKTGDSLPAVWLWVIVLAAGVVTFALSLREIINSENPEGSRNKSPSGLKRALLLLGILVIATARFIARKIKQNKAKALLTASGAVVIVSLIVLASTILQYKTAEDLYIDAEETYVETASEELSLEQTEVETAKEHGWWDCVDVNVEELAQEYPDVVGWIYFENEDISYPIMYSGDNAKYLSTAYTGEKAKAGAIFIDGESTPDFSDPHSLVYGHNMRDLSMFGKLRYYKNTPGYYEDHQYFQVFTKDSVYRYQIFACEVVPDNHDVFWVFGKEPTDYWKMLKEVERDSFINTDIRANESDHVITLATCTNNDDERLIVCAVRTDAYQYQQ